MKTIDEKLDFWLQHNWNVLLVGSHGIGKTTVVSQAFDRANLNWQYFSAPTMDPWVDFIGVPKEKIDPVTGASYLDLIRPQAFENDEVEAIFIDEFNRAKDKVTNALLQLIQFKSINGRKFNNLKVVWAAINPADEAGTYHVEEMDPANEDRFHIKYELPSEPNRSHFVSKYGDRLGNRAVDWWTNNLPEEIRPLVSPRRLDYALEIFVAGGDLADCLPRDARPKTLKSVLERVGLTSSHTDRWLEEPHQYMQQLSQRGDKTDIVEAIADLIDISNDLAVSLVGQLPPPKLGLLAQDNRTIGLLLHYIKNNPSSRNFATAITKNAENFASAVARCVERVPQITETELGKAAVRCLSAPDTKIVKAWDDLYALMIRLMTDQLMEYDDCDMLLTLLADNDTTSQKKSVAALTNYVMDVHPGDVLRFVNTNPSLVIKSL